MYEHMTFENIQKDMLDRVESNVDKREGSILWDATATVAYSLAEVYFLLEHYLELLLPDTAVGEYLDRFVTAFGLTRKPAVKALRQVSATETLSLGSRWELQDTTYIIISQESEFIYVAECEQEGDVGNKLFGRLFPLGNSFLGEAQLQEVLSAGSEEETDEALRIRFLEKVQKPSTSGNVYDYYNWAMSCNGVGAVKVFPLAGGPGTVKLVIANENKQAAGMALVESVAEYIEKLRPIGATVTVVSAVEKSINVSARVKLTKGSNLGTVQATFEKVADDYLQSQSFTADYISHARMGNLLLDIAGVEDYTDLKLSGTSGNLTIEETEIPVLGTVRLEVM